MTNQQLINEFLLVTNGLYMYILSSVAVSCNPTYLLIAVVIPVTRSLSPPTDQGRIQYLDSWGSRGNNLTNTSRRRGSRMQ